MAAAMGWEILWPLILGFALAGVVQAVVSMREGSKLMPASSPRSLISACGLGGGSSSCSYGAVAVTRSLVRKGADFVAAMAFELASTNLVAELGIILAVLMGWQFTLAEFVGGPIMVAIMAVLFRSLVSRKLIQEAREQAEKGLAGRMEGHAEMDMAVTTGKLLRRLVSAKGRTAISHYFVMDWVSIWQDLALRLLVAGAIAAFVPNGFWNALFLQSHPALAKVWGPLIGPVVAILSFVCSAVNVPLAAVLWNGGISFGGVVSFLFADLIVLPILNIYRRYYGLKISVFLLAIFYVSMALAALAVEFIFGALHLIPQQRHLQIVEESIRWDYTTGLNIIFLMLAVVFAIRFLHTVGPLMLRYMS